MIGVVALTTFLVFFIEGLVHYNIGKNKLTKLQFPQGREIFQWILTLTFFSLAERRPGILRRGGRVT
jgi:hypothetical protein